MGHEMYLKSGIQRGFFGFIFAFFFGRGATKFDVKQRQNKKMNGKNYDEKNGVKNNLQKRKIVCKWHGKGRMRTGWKVAGQRTLANDVEKKIDIWKQSYRNA